MNTRKLRLLLISTDRDIFREGSEVRERMRGYASISEGITIIVFTKWFSRWKPIDIAPNCRAYPTNSLSRWLYIWSACRLAKKLFTFSREKEGEGGLLESVEKVPLDLVSAQDPFECGLAGYFISKKFHIPLQLQVHADFLNDQFQKSSRLNSLRTRIARFLFHKQVTVRVVSERIKTSVLKKMSFKQNAFPRIEVFPAWVDCERFKNAEDTVHLQEKYPGYDLLVLVVARLEKEKNVLGAIEILAISLRANPEATIGLVIVGDGSQRKYLEKKARSLGVHDRVFFEGAVPDVAPYYKSADVLLVTSFFEGYGRQIVEAVASGCLIATRDVGVAKEFVTRSNGVVCEENDADCLIHNLLLLATEPVVLSQLKNSARTVAERSEWETKEHYLERYQKLLAAAVSDEDFIPFF